jgi:carboxypeptidase C (cathepsin A)
MINGCIDQYEFCRKTNRTSLTDHAICSEAQSMCRDNVEGPYYAYGGRGVYDIRHPLDDPTPPPYFKEFLNLASTQHAIGVRTNYTQFSNNEIYFAFQQTGDFVYPIFLEDLQVLLDSPVRIALIYGDSDYICNWFGGEAVSMAANFTGAEKFRAAGYTPMVVDGVQYGETREYGNFSFTRVYEAGHEVPYYQPLASLALFNRTINKYDMATGDMKLSPIYATNGSTKATHTNSFVPLPSTTSSAVSGKQI